MPENIHCEIKHDNSEEFLRKQEAPLNLDLTFLDPPFNQGKEYNSHYDSMSEEDYWDWMTRICRLTFKHTAEGGAIYFMQREKNVERVLRSLREAGWTFQNLIVWKKKTSAVPNKRKFGLHYQVIVFATKGKSPRIFNKLRIEPPMLVTEKYQRPSGVYVTDVWDDIRELTSGYFAGDEPFRLKDGERAHKQQSPIQLLTRIILSSTKIGDSVFDPFAGTGTTLVVAKQLERHSLGVEIDASNCLLIEDRIAHIRPIDDITRLRKNYMFTRGLDAIWRSSIQHHDVEHYYNERMLKEA